MKITVSQSDQAGDIPCYEYTLEEFYEKSFEDIRDQLCLSEDSVFVCFNTYNCVNCCESTAYERSHPEFFITNDADDAFNYFNTIVEPFITMRSDLLNFNFFCFKTYEEAFSYCIYLKEGL
jgi:hypothetical protein